MSDEQSLRVALALVERGILTQPAARAIAFFSSNGLFCRPMQAPNGEVSIIFGTHCYTPAGWNALIVGDYPPTMGDVLTSIQAVAATPGEPDGPDGPVPAPAAVVAGLRASVAAAAAAAAAGDVTEQPTLLPGSPAAEAELERRHQVSAKRPHGAGALAWGVALLVFWFAVGIAALGFWRVIQLFWR